MISCVGVGVGLQGRVPGGGGLWSSVLDNDWIARFESYAGVTEDVDGVAVWEEQISGETVTQSVGSAKPQLSPGAVNGRDTITFSLDDYLENLAFPGFAQSEYTIVVVGSLSAAGFYTNFFDYDSDKPTLRFNGSTRKPQVVHPGSSTQVLSSADALTLDTFYTYLLDVGNSASGLYINNVLKASGAGSSSVATGADRRMTIGARAGGLYHLSGDIGLVGILNRLDSDRRTALYLDTTSIWGHG